ncbi:kinetochore Sim4 complex subunit Fta4, partial [Pyronema omphalodes]
SPPSIYAAKTTFLSQQVRSLSNLPRPPPKWRQSLPSEHGDLSDSVLEQVFSKLSLIVRKHHNHVYPSQTLRHVAEQIDQLYWQSDDEPIKEIEVLKPGVDLTLKENIEALPESYPNPQGATEEELEAYETLRARMRRASEVLEKQRQKRKYYEELLERLKPFMDPVENVQPNLATRDGQLNEEIEKMKMLAVLLAVQVEKAGMTGKIDKEIEDSEEEE